MTAIRTVDFDRLASSAPLNKQAAVDYHASGEGWNPEKVLSARRWDVPPPMRAVPWNMPEDLTRRTFDRLTVVGLAKREEARSKSNKGARWVVRCVCGAYELRASKTLLAKPVAREEHMCSHCDYVLELQAGRVVSKTVAERLAEKRP